MHATKEVRVRARHKPCVRPPRAEAYITRARLTKLFGLSCVDAAAALGVGRTCFKRVCRLLGIKRWPDPRSTERAARKDVAVGFLA